MSSINPNNFKSSKQIAQEILDMAMPRHAGWQAFDKDGHIADIPVWNARYGYGAGSFTEKLHGQLVRHLLECTNCAEKWDAESHKFERSFAERVLQNELQKEELPAGHLIEGLTLMGMDKDFDPPQPPPPANPAYSFKEYLVSITDAMATMDGTACVTLKKALEHIASPSLLNRIHRKHDEETVRNPVPLLNILAAELEKTYEHLKEINGSSDFPGGNGAEILRTKIIPLFAELNAALGREQGQQLSS